jgi:hypothetical protein
VVADALSQRSHLNHLVVKSISSELCDKLAKLKIVPQGVTYERFMLF